MAPKWGHVCYVPLFRRAGARPDNLAPVRARAQPPSDMWIQTKCAPLASGTPRCLALIWMHRCRLIDGPARGRPSERVAPMRPEWAGAILAAP